MSTRQWFLQQKVLLKQSFQLKFSKKVILGKTDNNKNIINECFKIHNELKTPGCYNIQLILTKNKVYTFEINPRISTTTCLAIYAGVDIVNIFMKNKSNNSPLKI